MSLLVPHQRPAEIAAAQQQMPRQQHPRKVRLSHSRMLLALVSCLVLPQISQASVAVGCGEDNREAVECPRVLGQLRTDIDRGQLSFPLPPQATPCEAGRPQVTEPNKFATCVDSDQGKRGSDRIEDAQSTTKNALMEVKPGKGTVCGHGNREYSFFIQVKATEHTKALVIFLNGGICWDSDCKTNMTMNSDNMVTDTEGESEPEPSPAVPTFFKSRIGRRLDEGIFAGLDEEWAIWIIPDCTGDDHIGNRSITYDAGRPSCFTAHHKGGVNTGAAIDYMLDNINGLQQVVLLGTGNNPEEAFNRGFGGVGAAFWAKYMQDRLPSARIRTVLDSAMGIYGPAWKAIHRDDPWGAKAVMVPDAAQLAMSDRHLLPPVEEWSLSDDDMTAYYRWVTHKSPSLAFADVSSTDDPVQIEGFVQTGGRAEDCCLEGCGCPGAPVYGMRGGGLDWTKTRKVQVLQRAKTMPNHYRSWLRESDKRFLLSMLWPGVTDHKPVQDERLDFCPRLPPDSTLCPAHYMLRTWFSDFILSDVVRGGTGEVLGNTFTDKSYEDRAFGLATCQHCLGGIPGGREEMGESCNATFYAGETLFTVAAKYHSDWMALWSLNGVAAPDVLSPGNSYRFAHEYIVQHGDTVESIASRFGNTVDAIVDLNYNIISHITNPRRLTPGDRLCLVPDFATHKDRMGNPICDPSDPRVATASTI